MPLLLTKTRLDEVACIFRQMLFLFLNTWIRQTNPLSHSCIHAPCRQLAPKSKRPVGSVHFPQIRKAGRTPLLGQRQERVERCCKCYVIQTPYTWKETSEVGKSVNSPKRILLPNSRSHVPCPMPLCSLVPSMEGGVLRAHPEDLHLLSLICVCRSCVVNRPPSALPATLPSTEELTNWVLVVVGQS